MTSVHSVQPDDIAEEMADERDWGVARAWHMGVAAGRIAFDRRGYHAIRESSRIRCSEQLMKRVFDEVLVCRASHTRLEVSGAAAPVTVPGCGCVVSSGAGRHFSKMGRCGLCKTALPGGTSTDTDADAREGFRTNAAALQLVRDANNIRLPLLEDIFMYSAEHKHTSGGACRGTCFPWAAALSWECENFIAHGTKGRSWYGKLYAQEGSTRSPALCTCRHVLKRSAGGYSDLWPTGTSVGDVTVHALPIPGHGRDANIIHHVVHGIVTQHFAALVSLHVLPVVAFHWPFNRRYIRGSRPHEGSTVNFEARVATSGHVTPLASHVAAHNVGLGTVKLRAQKLMYLCTQLTRAVLSIHRFGMVHCGISPKTVMVQISLGLPQVSFVGSADSATIDQAYDFETHNKYSSPWLSLTCFSKAHHHTKATAIGRCADAGCAVREMRAREMEGHVCAAADVHGIGQTMAFVAARWLDDAEHGMPDAVAAACKRARQQIKAMTDAPGECCLVQASAAFEDLHSDLCLLE